ncbi:hypothetical protein [Pontiella sp.]|uniref:hypothetical protein n=1 Tax=Pontiella sp. TaxID=2837462 RepID=UPI00356481B9
MSRHSFIAGLIVALLGIGVAPNVAKAQQENSSSEVQVAISAAEKAVQKARADIEKGKEMLALIPEDSPLMPDIAEMVEAAAENWKVAVDSLKGAKESAGKIESAGNPSLAGDYALLAKVNAGVALSGAKIVGMAVAYVEAVATNKTESLDIIRTALRDAVAASSQVQFNYDRVKKLITEKYSK